MKRGIAFFSLIFLFLIFAGCANYGRLRLESGPGATMTVQKLVENWQDYHILATGVEPNVPAAIIFVPKDSKRKVIGERWWELKDYKWVADTVGWIQAQISPAPYYPRLWKMLGPDGYLYGYMYTSWDSAVMNVQPDGTMTVMDIPMTPSMAVGAGEIRAPN